MTEHDDDDSQLSSLRAVWLNMPDEEPPERGLAELLAAARVKADEMARPSWWQRLVALLRRPAVLALATVLVLLGGAVFVGQRRDKLEAVHEIEPAERVPNAVVAPGPAATGSAASAEALGAAPVTATSEQATQDPSEAPAHEVTAEKDAEPAPARVSAPERQGSTPTVRPRGEPNAPGRAPTTSSSHAATRSPARTTTAAPSRGIGAGGGGPARAGTTSGALDDKQSLDGVSFGLDSTTSAPSPDPPPREAPKAAADLAGEDDASASRPPSRSSRAAQYLAQARSAAARGDCAAARVLLDRAARADASAYRKAVASDATLKKCR